MSHKRLHVCSLMLLYLSLHILILSCMFFQGWPPRPLWSQSQVWGGTLALSTPRCATPSPEWVTIWCVQAIPNFRIYWSPGSPHVSKKLFVWPTLQSISSITKPWLSPCSMAIRLWTTPTGPSSTRPCWCCLCPSWSKMSKPVLPQPTPRAISFNTETQWSFEQLLFPFVYLLNRF